MVRKPNPETADQILSAAKLLLKRGGEKAVSLRTVADAAGITTATVYKRFRTREVLMQALGNRERLRFFDEMDHTQSLEELCEEYLNFALKNRHEYRLIYGIYWMDIFSSPPGEPALEWAKEQFARRYGGKASEYDEVARWLRMLLHGGASLLINSPRGPKAAQLKKQCLRACAAVIADAKKSGASSAESGMMRYPQEAQVATNRRWKSSP